jgi:four helix bundle protein
MRPHKNLDAWKESIRLVKLVYNLTLPDDEKYNLRSQVRRAAVSVPTNIAEGAARESNKEYLRFLIISRGSLSEIDTLLTLIRELLSVPEAKLNEVEDQLAKVSAILQGLINKVRKAVNK